MEKNYEVLGLEPGASWTSIRTAFKFLVFKYHPEKSQRPDSAKKFKEVHEAYKAIEKSLKKSEKVEDNKEGGSRSGEKIGPKKEEEGEKESQKKEKKTEELPIERELFLFEAEILRGCQKTVKLELVRSDGSYLTEEIEYTIDVRPESKFGDKVHGKCSQGGVAKSDVLFILRKSESAPDPPKHQDSFLNEEEGKGYGKISSNDNENDNKIIERDIFLTQEELLHGHIKKILIHKAVLQSNGSNKFVSEIVNVNVRPGSKVGDKIAVKQQKERVFTIKLKKPAECAKDNLKEEAKIETGKNEVQDPQVNLDLLVTAEELLHGCTKRIEIMPIVQQSDGSYAWKEKVLEINLEPGAIVGKTIRFHRAGDEGPNKTPADIIYTVKLKNVAESKNVSKDERSRNETDDLPQDPPIEYDLVLTPEELLNGCKKKRRIMRKIQRFDGTPGVEERTLTVDVKPNSKVGMKVTLFGKGDHLKGKKPTDVVYTLKSTGV